MRRTRPSGDRKSTRLNSSHLVISYAVFLFKKSKRLNSSHLVISYVVLCLDKNIHLLMKAKLRDLSKSRNVTSLRCRFKSLDTLKVKIISVQFRRIIRTNHKKASKIWRHENIQLGVCQT